MNEGWSVELECVVGIVEAHKLFTEASCRSDRLCQALSAIAGEMPLLASVLH